MPTKTEAKEYHRIKDRMFFVSLLLTLAVLQTLLASGLSIRLRDVAFGLFPLTTAAETLYFALFALIMGVVQFPLTFYEDFWLEHRYQLSRQTLGAWLLDEIKKAGIGFLLAWIVVMAVFFSLARFPNHWWLWAGGFWLLLNLFLTRITPEVLIPLFYKYSEVQPPELRQRVLELFQKAKVKIKDVYSIDFSKKTRKANAFICGMGQSRRVVLTDTLTGEFSLPEIETVVAHEIGHYKHQDILKLTIVNTIGVFAGFYVMHRIWMNILPHYGIMSPHDIAGLPLFALLFLCLNFLLMPVFNGYSRRLEVAADRFSLQLTQKPNDFISMIRKLGDMNLAEIDPGSLKEFLFYSHPPISRRIRLAESFREELK